MKHCPNPECSHLETTGKAGEYRDDIEVCSDCGSELTWGEPPEPEPAGKVRWVIAMVMAEYQAAQMAKSTLGSEGIPCEIQRLAMEGDGIVGGAAGGYQLVVPDHLVDTAMTLLEAHPVETVELPDDEDLEFVDLDGAVITEVDGQELLDDEEEAPLADDGAVATGDRTSAADYRPPRPAPQLNPGESLTAAGGEPAVEEPRACPRCGSSGITREVPEPPEQSRGLFRRLFRSPADWACLSCQHRW